MADADVSMTLLAGDLRQKQGSDWRHGTSARDQLPLNLHVSGESPVGPVKVLLDLQDDMSQ